MKKPKFLIAGVTDVGRTKSKNEDACFFEVMEADGEQACIMAVADGVGGLANGEIASSMTIENIKKWWGKEFKVYCHDIEYLKESLRKVFHNSNREIMEHWRKNGYKMATTLSVLLIYKGRAFVFHTGDSRIYQLRGILNQKLFKLTEDHSCSIEKNINGELKKKNFLTECLGNKEEFTCYTKEFELKKNDHYIVCSDGIYKTISDDSIERLIRSCRNDMEMFCGLLVDMAKSNGEKDNITVLAAKINKLCRDTGISRGKKRR